MDFREKQWVEESARLFAEALVYMSKRIAEIEFETELEMYGIEYAMQISWEDSLHSEILLVNAVTRFANEISSSYPYKSHIFGGIGMIDCIRAINKRMPKYMFRFLSTEIERMKFTRSWDRVRRKFSVFEIDINYGSVQDHSNGNVGQYAQVLR